MKALTRLAAAPVTARSLGELGYALAGLPLGLLGFSFSVVSLTAGTLLVATLVGLPLTALSLHAARRIGAARRGLGKRLLGLDVPAPATVAPAGPGPVAWLDARLRDPTGWLAHAHLLLAFPVAVLAFAVAVVLRVGALAFVIGPLVQGPVGAAAVPAADPVPHLFVTHYGQFAFDTWPKVVLLVLQGLAMWLVSPWALRAVLVLDQLLVRWLLGPTAATARVRALEWARAAVIEDAATRLRRIERDLHDGTQAQLVAVTMKLALAREKLAPGPSGMDPARARELVDTALTTARTAAGDLRVLVAGIHPPVLDEGLQAALATIAARSPIPVRLTVDLPTRPSPAVESIVYFSTAELLTNAAKHSGAGRIDVRVTSGGGLLHLRVTDDGNGGAAPPRPALSGSGLAGLAARARSVDGAMSVVSPVGGPTTVRIDLPLHP